MNKEELKNIVSEILGNSDEASFNKFLIGIAASVKGNQAIKLDGIGHFQLKKEPLSRMERKMEGNASEKDILLFLPEGELGEDKIISLEIEKEADTPSEFNESVFDIRINEPTIISDTEEGDENPQEDELLFKRIDDFVASGTVIEDYELLNEKGEVLQNDLDNEKNVVQYNKLEDDIVLSSNDDDFTEAEINKEFLNPETDDSSTEYESTSSSIETEITGDDIKNSEFGLTDLREDKIENDELEDDKNEEGVNPFDELDNYIKDETEDEAEAIINSEPIEENEPNKESNTSQDSEKSKTKSTMFNKAEKKKWYKNPIFYIAALSLLVAVIVLFFFFSSDTKEVVVDDSNTFKISHTKNEKNVGLYDSTSTVDSTSEIKKENEKQDKQTEKSKVTEKQETEVPVKKKEVKQKFNNVSTGLYRDIKNDQSITQRIYFDGEKYTVQSSSWKSKTIAEREVSKLRKRGYDAFIYKVFIKAKNGTWHRVRIGYFNSRKEAEEFLKKNKI